MMRFHCGRRACRRLIRIIILAACATAPLPVAAQTPATTQLTVPPVTVTAPAFVPLYLRRTPGDFFNTKAYRRNPYVGNNRVEEDKFTQVPCSKNRIAYEAADYCLEGYHLLPGQLYGTERPASSCQIDHDVTIYNINNLSVEADVLVFDPYKLTADAGYPPPTCYVAGFNGYDRDDFEDMNRVTRAGTDWHDFDGKEDCYWADLSVACEAKSIRFSHGAHKCIAVRRPGPRWESGFVWMLTASICRTDKTSLQPGDVDHALGALSIRTYDPVGNIARPPK
jgi:hypothetical protein